MTPQFNRSAIFASLGLALALVVAVLFGAKYYFNNYARQPVSVAAVQSDLASSAQCTQLIDALPEKFMGLSRSKLSEPAPAGVAAWAEIADEATTLRCGVDMPYQYSTLSQTEEIDGTHWLQVRDMTKGSSLTTWYTTDRFPTVAVTTWDDRRPSGIGSALDTLERSEASPRPAPLSQLASADNSASAEPPASVCDGLDAALPGSLADGYTRDATADVPAHTAVWRAQGREEIVVRCGVAPPAGYKPGEKLQQINQVPWFEDTTLAEGTTAGTWYALGRATDIAVHAPEDVTDTVLPDLSGVIAQATPEQRH